jgi:O-antigen ligase
LRTSHGPTRGGDPFIDIPEGGLGALGKGLGASFWTLQAYLFVGLSQTHEHFLLFGKVRPLLLLGSVLLILVVSAHVLRPTRSGHRFVENAQSAWLLAFALACVASAFFGYDSTRAMLTLEKYLTTFAVYAFIVHLVHSRREVQVTLLTIAAGVGVFLTLSVWEWLGGRYEWRMGVRRMVGIGITQAGPNDFVATLTSTTPVVVWIGVYARSWLIRFAAFGFTGLMSYAVFMTSSRSGMVGWVMCGIFAVAMLPTRKARIVGGAAAAVLVLALGTALTARQVARLESIIDTSTYEDESSASGRIVGYRIAWRVFSENPILGVGPGNFTTYRRNRVDGVFQDTHNLAGQVISEFGIAGAVTFLGYLVAASLFAWRSLRRLRGSADSWDRAVASFCLTAVFCLLVMLVTGLAGHNLLRANWYFVPALALVAVRSCGAPGTTRAPEPLKVEMSPRRVRARIWPPE